MCVSVCGCLGRACVCACACDVCGHTLSDSRATSTSISSSDSSELSQNGFWSSVDRPPSSTYPTSSATAFSAGATVVFWETDGESVTVTDGVAMGVSAKGESAPDSSSDVSFSAVASSSNLEELSRLRVRATENVLRTSVSVGAIAAGAASSAMAPASSSYNVRSDAGGGMSFKWSREDWRDGLGDRTSCPISLSSHCATSKKHCEGRRTTFVGGGVPGGVPSFVSAPFSASFATISSPSSSSESSRVDTTLEPATDDGLDASSTTVMVGILSATPSTVRCRSTATLAWRCIDTSFDIFSICCSRGALRS
eukprot:m.275725 g.275725  ORF g.275725 m.275725 type:complete len:310 (-) comp26907_c0_seq1:2606-3535(-)